MTPTQQGRFCNSCAREVIDFSTMTDQQVLNYFTTLTAEKVCGRVLSTQLDTPIERPQTPGKKLFWYWNYIVMFFLLFSKSNLAKAQTKGKVVSVPVANPTCTKTMGQMVSGVNIINKDRIISGKVTDANGDPVPFATIKIKGAKVGLSADQKGGFSIKVKPGDVLTASAYSHTSIDVSVGSQDFLNIIMEAGTGKSEVIIAMAGGISYRNLDVQNDYSAITQPKHVAVFEIKDEKTGLPIDHASFVVTKTGSTRSETFFTDKKGIYKLKRIKEDDGYHVKVFTGGYETNEFTISGNEFNERKEAWEVYLKKQVVKKSTPRLILGGISSILPDRSPLHVLDGNIIPGTENIDYNNIESVTVLAGPAAAALFGPAGANGAILMVSKKLKNLDTVKVRATTFKTISHSCVTGAMRVTHTISATINTQKEEKIIQPENRSSIYPNPVQRGNAITLALQLIATGIYHIQVTDVNGQIILQKEITAITKSPKEMLPCDSRWAAGIYYISVFNDKSQLINKSSFIVQ
jgi:hypothetical protein